jgi:hypothetical protein
MQTAFIGAMAAMSKYPVIFILGTYLADIISHVAPSTFGAAVTLSLLGGLSIGFVEIISISRIVLELGMKISALL